MTTRRSEAMARDLTAIRREAAWLIDHVAELDIIAHSPQHQEGEQAHVGHQTVTESPDLSSRWQPRLRANMGAVARLLKRSAVELTTARVALEQVYGGPGSDVDKIGTELEPGELDRLRKAKAVRDAHQSDYRFGEFEMTPDTQPAQRFK